ncbi:nitroreductase/quinone reductase family protein [Micromonospora sp. NPDC005223]|uniref:nitroreductase/quinone reductase family protein n=1 Tax=unclassified Micromonospora TaxID=2617518 RepID=UPI0033A8FCC4
MGGVMTWMYRGRRPNRLARMMNALSAWQYGAGLAPRNWMTMEVPGRRTGRTISVPIVVADHDGERYVVSMLGERANWVANVRAADGRAVLRRRGRESVRLVDVPVAQRPPILRRHLALAPGARPHAPVDRHAPLADFTRVAAGIPVFRIVREEPSAR